MDTDADYPEEKTIHQLFEEQVEQRPEHTAAVSGNEKLTYRRLNEKANSLARLLRAKGVGPDTLVAVISDRSLEMIVGIFGILKAGGAYLPVSTTNPVKRIVHLLKESQTKIVLTRKKFLNALSPAAEAAEIFNLEDEDLYREATSNLPVVNTSRDLIYVIYTSGSTGKPKGVGIEHRSVVNRLNWMQRKYPLTPGDVILQKTPFFFDVSVWEMFWWSIVGAGVCFLMPGGEKFPQAIVETVETKKVTVMHFVPSMMSVFLEYLRHSEEDVKRLVTLKQVFSSGEALTSSHVGAFNEILHKSNRTRLTNLYGPTEATVDVTYYDCPVSGDTAKIPIGKPIDNIQLYILDEDNREVKEGDPGELCIAGVGVARGYLNRPELTAEKFCLTPYPLLLNPYYRTGDLARQLPDGNIEFLGRRDHQVKIHGLRIELGEIEAALSSHPAVRDSVVVVKQFSKNVTMIVGYLVPGSGQEVSGKELKLYLKEILPDYMVPNMYVTLEDFPLTPSGKVDRKALPEPSFSS